MATTTLPLAKLIVLHLIALCHCEMLVERVVTMAPSGTGGSGGTPYISLEPRGLTWCSKECERRSRCVSFNFVKSSKTCHLHDTQYGNAYATVTLSAGTASIESSAILFESLMEMLGPCDVTSCSTTERCEASSAGAEHCEIAECTVDVPSVEHAYVRSETSRLVGGYVIYACSYGFLEGDADVYCLTSGEWSTANFVCQVFRTAVQGNSGTLISPNYPNAYSNYQDYTMTVTLDQYGPQTVQVTGTLNMEICCDYIMFNNDGVRHNGYYVGLSVTFTVQGNTWTVLFHTDGSVTKTNGFLISYAVV